MALVGIRGYGQVHLANILRLAGDGRVRLAGCADTVLPDDRLTATVAEQEAVFVTDYHELFAHGDVDVAVVATPPHLHAEVAGVAMLEGAHVLVEKPPVVTHEEWKKLAATARASARHCQVGFQSLGSGALDTITAIAQDGSLGSTELISAWGLWSRTATYYARAPWAGRRSLDQMPVRDGVLSNPFAHAVMNCIVVAAGQESASLRSVEVERYHAHDIEVDDTAALRVTLGNGRQFVVAVTLCAEHVREPRLRVQGSRGVAEWAYEQDVVTTRTGPRDPCHKRYARTDLLENLVDVVTGRSNELVCPLERTGLFMRILDQIDAVAPVAIPEAAVRRSGAGREERLEIAGVDQAVQEAAEAGLLFSETGAPWAQAAAEDGQSCR